MLKKLNKNKGFTIIEVMIVLAIAGLILAIVLIAVPALQRNARNTSLKNDASALAAGVNEYKSNNDGARPSTISAVSAANSVTVGASPGATVDVKLSGGATVTNTATPSAGNIGWQTGSCNPPSNTRSFAIYYTPEATNTVTKCIDA